MQEAGRDIFDGAAHDDGRGDVEAVVERDARRHVVGAHHEGDQQQRGKGGAADGLGGFRHAA